MRALQYRTFGSHPEVVDIDEPTPGPGEVLLKVAAAGVCHSDEFLMGVPEELYPFGALPLTLGHEGAGTVAELGAGVSGVELGDSVAVYGPWGCGRCLNCAAGKENYCTRAAALGIRPPGLGSPGSMAEYMIVDDARHLVPLRGLDPVRIVSLTDAGLTPYHAIKRSNARLGAGTTAVVIGTGGLGHVAIQLLRALTGTNVVALDINEEKLALARSVGAHHAFVSDESAVAAVRQLTNDLGADAVFDFVGRQSTVDLAARLAALEADIVLVGIGGGLLPVGFGAIPYDASVRAPYWGGRDELIEVLDLARRGQVGVEIETYSLEDAPLAYEKLAAGIIRGRAVIIPGTRKGSTT